jgi:hypothetical protein
VWKSIPRQNPLHMQNETMSNSRFKLAVSVMLTLVLIAGGTLYLFAWEPLPAPTAAPVAPTPSPTSSTQAKITWSTTSIEVILSPGESGSQDLTFSSSLSVQNITIEAVPEIAGFLSIQPASVASLSTGQQQPVHIAFSIPVGSTLGTHSGTIHVRDASQTYPQTLKVTVNAWNALSDSALGIKLHYPAGWSASKTDSGYIFSSIPVPGPAELDAGEEIELVVENNADALPIEQWLLSHYQVDISTVPTQSLTRGRLISGQAFVEIRDVVPSESADNVQTFFSGGIKMFALRISPTSFQAEYEKMLRTITLL